MESNPAELSQANSENDALAHEEIARLAYELWESRGGGHGSAEQDWLEAERQLRENQLQRAEAIQTKSQTA